VQKKKCLAEKQEADRFDVILQHLLAEFVW